MISDPVTVTRVPDDDPDSGAVHALVSQLLVSQPELEFPF